MFNRLIKRSYMAEERIFENKGLSVETSKTEMQLGKKILQNKDVTTSVLNTLIGRKKYIYRLYISF